MWVVLYGSRCSTVDGEGMCDMTMRVTSPLHINVVWALGRRVVVRWVRIRGIP